jgi:hypothetical protein
MIERDYILRMFKLLGQALSRIWFFKEMKEYDSALTETDNSARTILGLNLDMIERMPISRLKDILGSDPSLVGSKLFAAGMLLKEKGELLELQNEEDGSVVLYMKSLSLFMEGLPAFEDFDDEKRIQAIDSVIGKLKAYELPVELRKKLESYFEKTGRYDKSEDMIFEIVGEDESFAPDAFSFYERLLLKSDRELEEGCLPRNEAVAGLAELRRKLHTDKQIP